MLKRLLTFSCLLLKDLWKYAELWLLGMTGVECRLPHKTIPKSLWMSKMAWRPAGLAKCVFQRVLVSSAVIHLIDNAALVKQTANLLLYCHTPLRLEYLPPHQEPRERKPCSTCFAHLLDLARLVSYFFHRHLSVTNRNGSELPSGQARKPRKLSILLQSWHVQLPLGCYQVP